MKITFVLLLTVITLVWGCSESSDPAEPKPDPKPTSPYSGTFSIADTLAWNTCATLPIPLDPTETVTVSDTLITFAGIPGYWNESELRGQGTGAVTTVPINPGTGCYGYFTLSFDIIFTDPDSLYGFFQIDKWFEPECVTPDCFYRYTFSGTR